KSTNKVHRDLIPLPLGYLQRFQETSRSLVLNLDLLTNRALHDIVRYIPLHPIPPEVAFKVLIHLCPSWMYRVAGVVSFTHNLLRQITVIWHTQSSLHPYNVVIIHCKVSMLPGLHFLLYLLDCFIIALTFLDPIDERWFQDQVGNFHFYISSYELNAQPFKF